jgi:hypothetical protein
VWDVELEFGSLKPTVGVAGTAASRVIVAFAEEEFTTSRTSAVQR